MRRRRSRISIRIVGAALGAFALAVAACGDDDGTTEPLDSGPDATRDGASDADPAEAAGRDAGAPAVPRAVTSTNGWTLRIETDPFSFELADSDGTALASATGASALHVGRAELESPRPDRFYDPRTAEAPRGVDYVPAGIVTALEDDGGTLRGTIDCPTGPVSIELDVSEPDEDVAVFHVVLRASGARVVLMRLRLAAGADDVGYHGLGELFDGPEVRGRMIPVQLMVGGTSSGTNERHVPVPFLVGTTGPGVFVQSRESGAFDVAAADPEVIGATFEGNELDLRLFATRDPIRAIEEHTRVTGRPRLPPLWAFGNMQWRNEWESGDEVLADLTRYREERFPLSVMWIDNPWQTSYNDLRFDESRFADPTGLIATMRRQGIATFLWSTPYLDAPDEDDVSPSDADNEAERLFGQAADEGWLVTSGGEPWISPAAPGASGAMIDFTNAGATEFWVERIAPLVAMGIRGFKLDYAEDVVPELFGVRPGLDFSDGSTDREMHGQYARLYHRAYRRALDEGAGEEGGVVIGRASVWGGQVDVDVIWPGDLDNDFRTGLDGEVGGLPASVSAVQSLAASGFPSFAADTGGYRMGMPERELLLRWAEHTALTPVFQLGGAGRSHNPWEYDDEAVVVMRALMRLHMDLVPYLRVQALAASARGTPPVRALGLAYPDDPGAISATDQYLLGDALLVAPVVEPGVESRRVHVPAGRWVRWQSGDEHVGPGDETLAAPIGTPVLLVREGAVVPMLASDVETLIATEAPSIVDLE
ncbi:MAG: glycoside hydrolase family 31 protein, partial [Deltaproteobacteria bacterium]|nr:glycoside hydrolase family 31 protein [Deltaproteobacteria bacterium]